MKVPSIKIITLDVEAFTSIRYGEKRCSKSNRAVHTRPSPSHYWESMRDGVQSIIKSGRAKEMNDIVIKVKPDNDEKVELRLEVKS